MIPGLACALRANPATLVVGRVVIAHRPSGALTIVGRRAIICWLAARALQRRGKVEKDTEKTEDLPPLLDPKS